MIVNLKSSHSGATSNVFDKNLLANNFDSKFLHTSKSLYVESEINNVYEKKAAIIRNRWSLYLYYNKLLHQSPNKNISHRFMKKKEYFEDIIDILYWYEPSQTYIQDICCTPIPRQLLLHCANEFHWPLVLGWSSQPWSYLALSLLIFS